MSRAARHGIFKRAAARRSPAPARTASPAELTAAAVFKIPTVAQVVAAGYAAERWESIRTELMEYRRRFDSDPEFRRDTLERYARHLAGLD